MNNEARSPSREMLASIRKARAKCSVESFKKIVLHPESIEIVNPAVGGQVATATNIIINGCKLSSGVKGFNLDGMDPSDNLEVTIIYNETLISDEFKEKIVKGKRVLSIEETLMICPICDGTGASNDAEMKNCKLCDGIGTMDVRKDNWNQDITVDVIMTGDGEEVSRKVHVAGSRL